MVRLLFILILFTLGSCYSKNVNESSAEQRQNLLQKYIGDSSVNQILIVSHLDGSEADVSFYVKQNDCWNLYSKCKGYVGKNGMGKTKEGDLKSPLGDFEIISAFGILPNPGTSLPYISVTPSVFACDENSEYYNQIIDTVGTGHQCKGESMYKISPQYNYGLQIGYNKENIYPNGSAIFLHCFGPKDYTAGCVAISEEDIKKILQKAEPGMRIYLDEYFQQ